MRENGYALDLQEAMEGGLCYAAPVFNYKNAVVAAAGITVLSLYHTPEKVVRELGPLVNDAGREICEALGYVGDSKNAADE